MNSSEKHFELAVGLAKDALKALLVVNGGAATALIALMDKSSDGKNYTCAILLFAAGAITSVIASCCGYFSQLYYANHLLDLEKREGGTKSHQQHKMWQNIALFFVFATIVMMVSGIVSAALSAKPT